MKAVKKIMTGAAAFAALGMAAPAAAQYPGYYPGYNQGPNVIGQVLNSILNPYGQQQQYGQVDTQTAVNRCATAVHNQLTQRYSAGYNQYGYNGYAQSSARVLQVTGAQPRSSSTLRVRGLATSGTAASYNPYGGYAGAAAGGYGGYAGYGGYGGYGGYAPTTGYAGGYNTAAAADLTFTCDIDYRGQIRDIDIDRRY